MTVVHSAIHLRLVVLGHQKDAQNVEQFASSKHGQEILNNQHSNRRVRVRENNMKIGNFEVTCTNCGSKKVAIINYHNENEAGVRFECQECGEKAEI